MSISNTSYHPSGAQHESDSDSTDFSITGVVLAGGRARRMGGNDKGLLTLAGEPMISHSVRLLKPQVKYLIINANRNIESYSELGYPVISDSEEGFLGPLAGMLTALDYAKNHCKTDYLITTPCDSPLLASDYVQRMQNALLQQQAQLSVASDGNRLQPVFALLSVSLLEDLTEYLNQGGRKIDIWFERHNMAETDFSDRQSMFQNINTPEDLNRLEKELA